MTINKVKLIAIVLFAVPMMMLVAYRPQIIGAVAAADDPAADFKAKCAACHTPTASKFYDPAKPEEEQVQAILKGKKGEKPPFMPGFEAKGMTEDQAKAMVTYMKTLKPAN